VKVILNSLCYKICATKRPKKHCSAWLGLHFRVTFASISPIDMVISMVESGLFENLSKQL
jgi:hypothetical protein